MDRIQIYVLERAFIGSGNGSLPLYTTSELDHSTISLVGAPMTDRTVNRRFEIDAERVPDLPGMMLATVEALKELGGSATIHELDDKVIELEGVTEAEQALTMTRNANLVRVNYYLAWARTYLKRRDALVNSSRGVWALTKKGAAISARDQTQMIYEQVTQEERERSRIKHQALNVEERDDVIPVDEGIEESEIWKPMLLKALGEMLPDAFERLSQRLLREAGFTKVEVRGRTGDGGIDGVGVLPVNLVSLRVNFQCKRWKGRSVGPKDIRDFQGALQGRADKGLFITTGRFTKQASKEASRDGAIAVDLIDGDRLCDLLKENRLGVETEMIEKVRIQSDWFTAI